MSELASVRSVASVEVPHPEKITDPAGEYETIRVEMRDTVKPDSPLVQTNWYAPHVGIVKIVTKRFVYVLKSFKQPE